MRPLRALAIAMLVGGIALIAIGVYTGEASVGIFLIFPFVMGSGVFSAVGVLLIIGAALVFIYDLSKSFGAEGGSWEFVGFDDEEAEEEEDGPEGKDRGKGRGQGRKTARKGRIKGGGIVFIGPVPVVFGADKKWTEYMMILAILLVVALCVVFFVMAV